MRAFERLNFDFLANFDFLRICFIFLQINTTIIHNFLKQNNFRGVPSLENIREFINETLNPTPQYEEYFEERLPEIDETDELKQLEEARDEINRRIEELQQQQTSTATNEAPSTEPIEEDTIEEPTTDKVESIIKSLYEKPFGTDIPLIALSVDECKTLAPLLKEWYEKVIKNNELNAKIGIECFGEDISVLTDVVFGNLNEDKTYEHIVKEIVKSCNYDYEKALNKIRGEHNELSLDLKMLVRTIINNNAKP